MPTLLLHHLQSERIPLPDEIFQQVLAQSIRGRLNLTKLFPDIEIIELRVDDINCILYAIIREYFRKAIKTLAKPLETIWLIGHTLIKRVANVSVHVVNFVTKTKGIT